MSANAEVFAALLLKPDLPDSQRAAFLWALRHAADQDAQGASYRSRIELALSRLAEAVSAERSVRVNEILVQEARASAQRLIRDVCGIVLQRDVESERG